MKKAAIIIPQNKTSFLIEVDFMKKQETMLMKDHKIGPRLPYAERIYTTAAIMKEHTIILTIFLENNFV